MGKRKNRSSGKSRPQSKRIDPRTVPPDPPPPKPIPLGKIRVLAEFKEKGKPLAIGKARRSLAPRYRGYICSAAWVVKNTEEQEALFAEVTQEVGNVRSLYHGTTSRNIGDITRKGLQTGRGGCLFGSGIYMGSPTKAFGYTGWGWRYRGGDACYILQVDAALGKVLECPSPTKYTLDKVQAEGFHSVAGVAGHTSSWGGKLKHDENVVYSPDQVIVRYIFEYQRTEEYAPPKPHKGKCGVVRKKDVATNKRNRAFADIISAQACGNVASIKVWLDDGTTRWICNTCLRELRLKIGTKVLVEPGTLDKGRHVKRIIRKVS